MYYYGNVSYGIQRIAMLLYCKSMIKKKRKEEEEEEEKKKFCFIFFQFFFDFF